MVPHWCDMDAIIPRATETVRYGGERNYAHMHSVRVSFTGAKWNIKKQIPRILVDTPAAVESSFARARGC
jgi:hypothetical protein